MKKKILSILFFALAVPLGLMAQAIQLLNNGDFESTAAADLTQYRVGVGTVSGSQALPATIIQSGVGRSGSKGLEIPVPVIATTSKRYMQIYVTPQHTWALGQRFTFQFYAKAGINIQIGYALTDGIGGTANTITDSSIEKTTASSLTGGWECYKMTGTVTQAMIDAGMKTITIIIRNRGTEQLTAYLDDFSWTVSPPEDITHNLDGVTYELNANGTATAIDYYYDIADMVYVTIPETVTGPNGVNYTVTSIGEDAFAGCTNLWTVALPATLENIGDRAFADMPPGSIYIHSTTPPAINTTVFSNDGYQRYIYVPQGSATAYAEAEGWVNYGTYLDIKELGTFSDYKLVFGDNHTATVQQNNNNVSSLDFSSGKILVFDGYQEVEYTITGFEPWSFVSCANLTSVKLSPYSTTVAEGAFFGCTSLIEVVIPESVTSIQQLAFSGCTSLETINIPASVTSIGANAFNECSNLTSVYCFATTPPALAGEANPFSNAANATLYVPEGTKADYEAATYWQDFGQIVEMDMAIDVTIDGINYILDYDAQTATVTSGNYTNVIDIPLSVKKNGIDFAVTAIGDNAFRGSEVLRVYMPVSVTSIGSYAFAQCTNMNDIELPGSVTSIGEYAFIGCTGLTMVAIPSATTVVSAHAFSGCTNLSTLYIHDEVTAIERGAFYNCPLTKVYCRADTPPAIDHENTFSNAANATLYVPVGTKAAYEAAPYWQEFGRIIEDVSYESGEELIANGDLEGSDYSSFLYAIEGVTEGIVPVGSGQLVTEDGNTVIKITSKDGAEESYNSEFFIKLSKPLREGEVFKFSMRAKASRNVTIQSMAHTTPGDYLRWDMVGAFDLSTEWKEYTYKLTVTSDMEGAQTICFTLNIDRDAADYYFDDIRLTYPLDALDVTIDGIHYNLNPRSGLAIVLQGEYAGDVTIPATVTYEGDEYTVKEITWSAFSGTDVTSITFPTTLTAIHGWSFTGSTLTEVTIPEGITEIEGCTFGWCNSLTSVTIPSTVTTIAELAFNGCTQLTSVYCNATTPPAFKEDTFQNIASDATLYVPAGTKTAYEAAGYGDYFANIVEMGGEEEDSELVVNGDLEGSDYSSFLYAISGVTEGLVPVGSGQLVTENGNTVIKITSNDNASEAWDTQFLIKLSRPLVEGETLTFSMRAKASRNVTIQSMAHTSPGMYKHYEMVGNPELSTEWKKYTYKLTVSSEQAGAQAICFMLNIDRDAADYYFDDISLTTPVTPDTDYSLIDNTLYLERHEGVAGGQVTLSVRMKNTADIAGYQFNLQLPEGVSVAADSDGLLMAELSQERTTTQKTNNFGATIQSDGTLQVLCGTMVRNPATGKLYTFEGNDGEVARITLNISEELATGDYPIYLKNVVVSTPELAQYETASLKSTLTVRDFIPGDVNGDGQVNVVDFLSTANYILGNTPEVFIVKAANVVEDLNEDGTPKINVTDFLGIANLILSSEETAGANSTAMDMEEAPRRAAGATPADIDAMDNVMYVEPVTAAPGTQQTLSIRMKNTSDHIAGYEFLLRLPEGITVATDADGLATAELSEERTTKRNTDHFLTNLRSDGLKVLCGTLQQDPATGKLYAFSGHDGEVARVTINIPADYAEGEYPVTLVNAVMAGNDESHVTAVSATNIAIRFDTPTGISLTTDTSVTDDQSGYYTLDGTKLNGKPSKKGVYIHNGKKEVVK